jgi:hypothetical protein
MRTVMKFFPSAIELGKAGWLIFSAAIGLLVVALTVPPTNAQENPAQAQTSSASSQQASSETAKTTQSTESAATEKPNAKAFPSPEAAAAALADAVRQDDDSELLVILGPDSKQLIHWTDNQDDIDDQRQLFVQKYDQMHRLIKEPDDTVALYVGAENWPLPIPLVEYSGSWYFDTDLGKQEILYRRIGRNEINALDVCSALVDAEKEYFGISHSFTSKFVSAAGAHDGLFWKTGNTNTRSPVGPYLAQAGVTDSAKNHQPFHGYFYRIVLQNQGGAGASNSGSDSNANHFVVVAFPAAYRSSGVMTFLVEENGDAYQKDLGSATAASAMKIAAGPPDNTWSKVE